MLSFQAQFYQTLELHKVRAEFRGDVYKGQDMSVGSDFPFSRWMMDLRTACEVFSIHHPPCLIRHSRIEYRDERSGPRGDAEAALRAIATLDLRQFG